MVYGWSGTHSWAGDYRIIPTSEFTRLILRIPTYLGKLGEGEGPTTPAESNFFAVAPWFDPCNDTQSGAGRGMGDEPVAVVDLSHTHHLAPRASAKLVRNLAAIQTLLTRHLTPHVSELIGHLCLQDMRTRRLIVRQPTKQKSNWSRIHC